MKEQKKKMDKRIKLTLIGSFIIIVIYLIIAHKTHLLDNISYIFFLLFILSHFLMHRGHGGHKNHNAAGYSADGHNKDQHH